MLSHNFVSRGNSDRATGVVQALSWGMRGDRGDTSGNGSRGSGVGVNRAIRSGASCSAASRARSIRTGGSKGRSGYVYGPGRSAYMQTGAVFALYRGRGIGRLILIDSPKAVE